MKKILLLSFFLLGWGLASFGQETAKTVMMEKKKAKDTLDVIDFFDASVAKTQKDLEQRRQTNKEKRQRMLRLINSSDLKERQKEKLSHDVLHNPFSSRLRKFVQAHKQMQETKTAITVINEE